jgi:hypothetical protein
MPDDELITIVHPGQPADGSGGYTEISANFAARRRAEFERMRSSTLISDLYDPQRRRATELASADAELRRRLAAPDPRLTLFTAHAHQAERRAEVGRLVELVARAQQLVDDLNAQQRAAETAAAAATASAVEGLVEQLVAGELVASGEIRSVSRRDHSREAQLQLARLALERLKGDLAAARNALRTADYDLAKAGLQILVNLDAALETDIAAIEVRLQRRKECRFALGTQIAHQVRSLNGGNRYNPAPRPAGPTPDADAIPDDFDWQRFWQNLLADPDSVPLVK